MIQEDTDLNISTILYPKASRSSALFCLIVDEAKHFVNNLSIAVDVLTFALGHVNLAHLLRSFQPLTRLLIKHFLLQASEPLLQEHDSSWVNGTIQRAVQ
jgi:hypothetical protein